MYLYTTSVLVCIIQVAVDLKSEAKDQVNLLDKSVRCFRFWKKKAENQIYECGVNPLVTSENTLTIHVV